MRSKITYVLIMVFLVNGCSTQFNTATKRQETLLYGDEKEKSIGASYALQAEKEFKFINDVDTNERVLKVLNRITAVCDSKDEVFVIRVIDDEEANAFSLPGGYIYINKGLLDIMKNDDQLAAVVGHEVGHVTAKHAMKRLQGSYGALVLQGLAIASGSGAAATGVSLASASLLFANSREDEFEADKLGVKYMRLAGYDPKQMKLMLQNLLDNQNKKEPRPLNYWRTHPYIPARMARADTEANGKSQYKDYLNITGDEK